MENLAESQWSNAVIVFNNSKILKMNLQVNERRTSLYCAFHFSFTYWNLHIIISSFIANDLKEHIF